MAELKEKCPHYDPVTREQIKPGKTCPEYNTLKGCLYAHPWQPTWDGDNSPFPTSRNVGSTTAATIGNEPARPVKIDMLVDTTSRTVDHDAMEVDTQAIARVQPSHDLVPIRTETMGEPDALEIREETPIKSGDATEGEAVATFIKQLVISLFQANRYSADLISFQNYKAQYKATVDEGTQSAIRDVCTPSVHGVWVEGRAAIDTRMRERQTLMDGWIEGLVALEGDERPRTIEGEEDQMMTDTGDIHVEGEGGESLLVQAMRQRKKRLERGVAGQRMVELLSSLDEVQIRLEEADRNKVAQLEGSRAPLRIMPPPTANAGLRLAEDVEMGEITASPAGRPLTIPSSELAPTLQTINDRINKVKMGISDVEVWNNDSFSEDLRRAVDKQLENYLAKLDASKATGSDPLEQVRSLREDVMEERTSCEALMRLLGEAPVFDAAVAKDHSVMEQGLTQLQNDQQVLGSLLNEIESRQVGVSGFHQTERKKLVNETRTGLVNHLTTNPTLGNELWKQAEMLHGPGAIPPNKQPLSSFSSLGYHIPALDVTQALLDVQNAQQQAWLAEYDTLLTETREVLRPIIQRTKDQMEKLERLEKDRLNGSVGALQRTPMVH